LSSIGSQPWTIKIINIIVICKSLIFPILNYSLFF
jgi:hypothetical protein